MIATEGDNPNILHPRDINGILVQVSSLEEGIMFISVLTEDNVKWLEVTMDGCMSLNNMHARMT